MLNKEEKDRVTEVLRGMIDNRVLTSAEKRALTMAIEDIEDRYTYRYRSARVCTPEPGAVVHVNIRPGTIKAEGMLHEAEYMASGYFAVGEEVVDVKDVYGWRYKRNE